ncbi:16S rRNA (uracil(1498)-N(3))-methyltransferase [Thiohalomonas denitrificans]|uniref:Ribosomal RNA small subunit methyltransferase E n=1 Tax=Thiohalomonas denitrificans TaxID=415747 RepID=A0A1G5QJ98_9GAMM|nr:16S rRNA (uracil(1498)-N(3))-methyltransferase [Thiohalomonas denitrificans]SCZ61817.1 16S rRNA (uracil1498-N3)-methyltransferase [Thiohalomonas denitrificans]
MRIPRIYQPVSLVTGQRLELDGNGVNHAVRVLRLKSGAPVILFNGEGGAFDAVLVEAERRRAVVELRTFRDEETESPLAITLVQGISRGDRMDYTIQKAVELGVARIVPVVTARTVVDLKGERREKRRERWQARAIAACEQCGRNRVPEVAPILALDEWLARPTTAVDCWMLDHRSEAGLAVDLAGAAATLLIGPEGGLTANERSLALSRGYRGLRLGPRVLRTETASVVALTIMQHRWGDLR